MKMSEKIPKISGLPEGRKLKQSDLDFMKIIEQQNFERVRKLKITNRRNLITGKINLNLATNELAPNLSEF